MRLPIIRRNADQQVPGCQRLHCARREDTKTQFTKWPLNALVIQEADGLVGHFDGTLGVPEDGDILVGGEKIFKALVEEFKSLL